MAVLYPGSLDNFINPTAVDTLKSPSHAGQHTDINNAVEALQAKVGVNNSGVSSSHDFKINALENRFPIVLADLGADSVDGSKIANLSIDSEHYVLGSIDEVHLSSAAKDTQYYSEFASSNQSLTTSAKTVVTQSIFNSYPGVALVTGVFSFRCLSQSGSTTAIGELTVSGSTQTSQALFSGSTSNRATVTQTWLVPLPSSSTRTFSLIAYKNDTSSSYEVNSIHSTMNIVFFRS